MENIQGAESGNGSVRSDTLRKIVSPRNISRIIPVISNSFHIERIFRDEKKITAQIAKTSTYIDEDFTVDEQLTKIWAQTIRYPLADSHNLARVAQYHQVQHDGSDVAKEEYLKFLKSYLLEINADEPTYKDTVQDLRRQTGSRLFSDIVGELEYPRISQDQDSLALLAELPFPIYITTSYHDFLERALIKNGKRPKAQVIFWDEGVFYSDAGDYYPSPVLEPNPGSPVVYHVFGLENYPETLVLSEDDYLRFLMSVVSDTDTQKPIIPLTLRRALATSHLLLLGYHLRDWEFRVFFRFLLHHRKSESKDGIFIQLKPKRDDQHLIEYLLHFFKLKHFDIEWKSSDEFIRDLWKVYKDQLS